MMAKQDLRNLDWLRTLYWSMNEDGIPFESMDQVKSWMGDRFPGASDEEILVKFVQMPVFESAPNRIQTEVLDDLNAELGRGAS